MELAGPREQKNILTRNRSRAGNVTCAVNGATPNVLTNLAPLYLTLMTLATYTPGTKVRITQQVPRLTGVMVTTIEGAVVKYEQAKTGSWYAHSKDHKLWMDRITLRKHDGELVVCNLDQYSSVEALGG